MAWRRLPRAAVAGVAVALMAGCSTHSSPAPTVSTSAVAHLSDSDVARITDGLSSADPAALSGVVLLPEGQTLDPSAAAELRAAGPYTVHPDTFTPVDSTHATVTITLVHPGGGAPATWDATLVLVDGTWKIESTVGQP